jgi:AraC-like DNA-binding protein
MRMRFTSSASGDGPGILSAAATGLDQFIARAGGDPERVFGMSGAGALQLDQPSSSLGLDTYCRIFEQAAADTRNDVFGLLYGQQFEPMQLGLLGYIALASANVGAAFENAGALFHHHQQRSMLRVVRRGEMSRIEYGIADRAIAARRQDAESSLGMFLNIVRHALGSHWTPAEVHFEHARPDSWSEHERRFGARVQFSRPCNALILRTRDLDTPMPRADSHLLALLKHNLSHMGLAMTENVSIVDRVAGVIRERLAEGEPSLDDVSRVLDLPNWTLQRRLRVHGCTYQELLVDVRRELALGYLRDPEIQISELAYLLGYSEISAFSRAFHRWMAMSPSEWRRGVLRA